MNVTKANVVVYQLQYGDGCTGVEVPSEMSVLDQAQFIARKVIDECTNLKPAGMRIKRLGGDN